MKEVLTDDVRIFLGNTAFRGLFPKVFTNLLHGTALGGTNTVARGVVGRVAGDNFYGPHGRYNRTFNFTLT
jgi:hypothetical protein